MSTTEEFQIVKGHRTPKVRGTRKTGTKYDRVIDGMKKLRETDYLIVRQSVPEIKVKQTTANIKHAIVEKLGKRFPRRTFEYKGIPAASEGRTGYDIIVRRIQ